MFDVRPAHQGLLIFDGDCGFCTTCVRVLRRALPVPPATTPYQWTDLEAYGLTPEDAQSRVWLVTPSDRFGGHLAIAAMLRHQPSAALRFVGWLMVVPPWSWAAATGYALVSRFRHRLPGGTPACQLRR
jgi:predicted DCC family thiol-disulfide oxidoreductase YuxK